MFVVFFVFFEGICVMVMFSVVVYLMFMFFNLMLNCRMCVSVLVVLIFNSLVLSFVMSGMVIL